MRTFYCLLLYAFYLVSVSLEQAAAEYIGIVLLDRFHCIVKIMKYMLQMVALIAIVLMKMDDIFAAVLDYPILFCIVGLKRIKVAV